MPQELPSVLSRRIRSTAAVLLAGYWLALFAGTHAPISPDTIPAGGFDKLLHLAAFFGLGGLLMLWRCGLRPPRLTDCAGVLAILTVYGAVDEITQIPVGRTAEFADWLADITGGLLGIAAFVVLQRTARRRLLRRITAGEADDPV